MKKILLAAAALVFGVVTYAQQTFDDVAKLNTEKYDFGKILQNKPVETYFELTNKSDKPIVIEFAQASCGCTTPEVPKEPIAPGATAKIKVTYSAAGVGAFTKPVTIKLAGIEQPKVVNIIGEQLPQAAWEEYVKAQQAAQKNSDASKTKNKTKSKSSGK